MTLAGVEARHDWLDARMQVVGYPPLQSMEQWSAANELLGAAVHAVIHHLQLNPPRIVRFVDAGLVAVQSSASINTKQQQQQHNTTTNNNRPNQQQYASHASPPAYHDSMVAAQPPPTLPTVPMPTIPHEFPELEPLTRDQLEVFMSNELEFRSLFQRLPIASAYRQIQHDSDILAASVATAQTNLQSEAELIELSAAVQRLSTELRDRVTAFQALEVQQDAICQPPDATAVCRILQHLKKQAFDESERIADDWLDTPSSSTMTADEFCDRFITARNTHHVRAAKLELLLNNQPQQQRSNHSNSR